jgi:hypothetical protein
MAAITEREALKRKLLADPDALAERFIDAATAAATFNEGGDWDSSTIEEVLAPIQDHLTGLGYPGIGEPDDDAFEFWTAVDEDTFMECEGHEHDPSIPTSVAGETMFCDGSCRRGEWPKPGAGVTHVEVDGTVVAVTQRVNL